MTVCMFVINAYIITELQPEKNSYRGNIREGREAKYSLLYFPVYKSNQWIWSTPIFSVNNPTF